MNWLEDEILPCSVTCAINADRADGGGYCSCGSAKQREAIATYLREAIGEDEKYTVVGHRYNTASGDMAEMIGDGEKEWKDPRNALRAELRKALGLEEK